MLAVAHEAGEPRLGRRIAHDRVEQGSSHRDQRHAVVPAEASDTVETLISVAAKKCRLDKDSIRLSANSKLLSSSSTVAALGLSEADTIMLHVKVGQQASTGSRSSPAPSFGAQGYGFFVNIVTSTGRALLLRRM